MKRQDRAETQQARATRLNKMEPDEWIELFQQAHFTQELGGLSSRIEMVSMIKSQEILEVFMSHIHNVDPLPRYQLMFFQTGKLSEPEDELNVFFKLINDANTAAGFEWISVEKVWIKDIVDVDPSCEKQIKTMIRVLIKSMGD